MEMYLKDYNIATVLSQWSCFWDIYIKKVITQKNLHKDANCNTIHNVEGSRNALWQMNSSINPDIVAHLM